jgi:hypothetical protein
MAAGSSDEPSSFVNIELYQTIDSHFQQKRLARLLVRDIGGFHDFIDFEWLLAERAQDILSLIQHDQTPTAADERAHEAKLPGAQFLDAETGGQIPLGAETTRSPNRSPLKRGTGIFDAETKPQTAPSAR